MKSIISASRRTDIPAFFGDWFRQQVKAGMVAVPNPFSGKFYCVSLRPEDVGAFVFWSRDYRPFLPILDEIGDLYAERFVFHVTVTGYTQTARDLLEPGVPLLADTLPALRELARRYGKDRIFWRFDPIIFSDLTPPQERLERFAGLAAILHDVTERCYISFVDLYGKVRRKFEQLEQSGRLRFWEPDLQREIELAQEMRKIAEREHIRLFTCCENGVSAASGITAGHCIDAPLLQKLFPDQQFVDRLKPTRAGCGCYASRDIGCYHSCAHGCIYCYANR